MNLIGRKAGEPGEYFWEERKELIYNYILISKIVKKNIQIRIFEKKLQILMDL